MRYIATLIFCCLPMAAIAQAWEDRRLFGSEGDAQILRIISSTDTSFFVPVIESFLNENPGMSVEYLVASTAEIDTIFRSAPSEFDLVISSAMDLQLKLANDGMALKLNVTDHPSWAEWGKSLFAFTSEPAAIVLNRSAFAGQPIPKTRQDLIKVLRERPDVFRGKVGTYDVRVSGLGYLFATQDARSSETFWRLVEVMGALNTRLYCCSGDMIRDLSEGTILVAYNVLGSYAAAQGGDDLEIVLPADFPTTMMRTALVSRDAKLPHEATDFIRHLIRLQSNSAGGALPLPPLNTEQPNGERSTIALEPALMTYLDKLKRRTFLEEWVSAIIQ